MKRLINLILLLPFLYVGALIAAIQFGGEVVELETTGSRGRRFPTSVWIVEANGDLWLRAARPSSEWLSRLVSQPGVVLTREGERAGYRAEIVEYARDRINDSMRAKYGWADQVLATTYNENEVVAVRLIRP